MSKRKLRSNFPRGSYLWAVRRAHYKALGIADADMEKPKIAVVNSSSELAICFSHLDGVAAKVKEAVRAAGGLPFECRTAAPSDFITGAGHRGGYILSARDLIPNDIEVQVEGAQLDGMVLLASCDKTVPGQLMAAARLNIPSIVIVCGYQASGEHHGRHVDIEDVFLHSMHVATGRMTVDELEGMAENAIRSPGVCSGMGTANSMHVVCEALGMALPGSAPVAANSPKMMEFVRQAGSRIVEMVWQDLKPRDILTPGAFANAVMAVLAVGGSINTVKHLQATAVEARLKLDIYKLFEKLAAKVPVLAGVRPIGSHSIEQFEAAGGARGVMKQLEGMLQGEALTVTGRSIAENLKNYVVADSEVIRAPSRPVAKKPALVILRGNLAPDAAIVKIGISPTKSRTFSGKAICFASSDEAIEALKRGRIKPGHVVVLRGLGVTGSPGMGGASRIVFALDGAELGESVAVVTDGQLSGLVNKGLVVGEVSPEAAAGGPIALVENGDPISIDVDRRKVELDIAKAELARRRRRLKPQKRSAEHGWLGIYRRNVVPLPKGAVLTIEEEKP
jgi:dihydroxy-acid dehydratase